jgi:hypothetical protein
MLQFGLFAPQISSGMKMAVSFAEVRFASAAVASLTIERRRRKERAASLPRW